MKILKKTVILAAFVSIGVYAAQEGQKNIYLDWKNRPSEKFSDPEANFNQVKKMLLENHYDSKISNEMLYEAATRGMLSALNPSDQEEWNKLYSPKEYKELQDDLKDEVTGIGVGMKFNEENGIATITNVIPHSAADSEGIKAGDEIISVEGKLYKGLQFRDLVYAIRGKVGESVRLKILRGDSILSKKVTREKINWAPVEFTMLKNKLGYIKIHYFSEKSTSLLKQALQKLGQEQVAALVIDLRLNEGGLFDQAVDSASLFTPKGKTVVRVEARGGKETNQMANDEPVIKNIPIAVLVSAKTSSGAELFAGSLSENANAKLIGEKTHGKWSAQTLEKLSNGFAYKFTVSMFKTPNGKSYSGTGLAPDVTVASVRESPLEIEDPEKMLEKDETLRTAAHLLSPNAHL